MKNLREKKKEDRKLRIQNAAIKFFGSIGYEATTIGKIASEAELGVGTFYNYYKSKEELLISIIADRAGNFTSNFEYVIKNRTNDIFNTISLLIDIYFKSFSIYNKLIWREFIANIFSKQPNMIGDILNIDSMFVNKLEELLIHFKSDGLINREVDELNSAKSIYKIMMFNILIYIADENITFKNIRESLDCEIKIVTTGLQYNNII